MQPPPKFIIHQDENNPVQGIEVDNGEGEDEEDEDEDYEPKIVINEEASDNDELYENLSSSSLPTHISDIEETEPLNIKEFIKDMRDKYKKLNLQDVEDRIEIQKEDPTQYPLYVKLNKLRKMREENMRKVVKVRSTDVLKANNDNFDKFMKKMIKENLEMANPGSYEGIFFKSNEDYVKFMKGKYTAKVDTLNIDQLCEKLGATYPRFKRDTNSRLIKSLRVTSDEYKLFEQYLFTNNFREIQNQEICLFEFVVESRLRDILKKIPLGLRKNCEENDKHSNITWKQLNHLKQSVAYFLQTHSHRAINDPNYDINDFQETDPRSKYNPHESKFFREPKQNNYSLVKKLKDIINILRNILPDSQSKFELAALYEGYYATMKHKVPPNSKESLRPPKSCHSSNATP